ncbi:Pex12 amino terminal region-domain-containing protein [Amylostereum chailletii]|nr:Pex12 amino terminal region-domain-containing protein [Amylostereum chailletii]
MTQHQHWHYVWEQAQPRIQSARDAYASLAPPQARIIRVGQLDAELLDQELVHLLQNPFAKALGLIRSSLKSRFEPELALFIQLTLYRLSVWTTGASYGAKLQDLRYKASAPTPSGLPQRILLIHGVLNIIVPYIHTRIRDHALSQAWPDAPTSDKRRKAWELLTKLETTHGMMTFVSFVAFLWDGRYRTLTDRLLGLQLVPVRRLAKRDVSYEFMNRQMVWHAFTEFLLFVLPLLPHRTLRRVVSSAVSAASHPLTTISPLLPRRAQALMGLGPSSSGGTGEIPAQRRGKYWGLPDNECAICHENAAFNLNLSDPAQALSQAGQYVMQTPGPPTTTPDEPPTYAVNTPYSASCGHVYCYVCLSDKMLRAADAGGGPWECLRCTERVSSAERVYGKEAYWHSEGEGDESGVEWGSDYFDELGSSVSGVSGLSIGSRSWVSGSDGDRSE